MTMPYRKPSLTVYRRDEILNLMGPVITQYGPPPCDCTDVDVPPVFKEANIGPLDINVGTGGCPDFQLVQVSFSGGTRNPGLFVFDRAEGVPQGADRYLFTIENFQFPPGSAPGDVFTVTVTLVDSFGQSGATCQDTIQIQDI